MTIDAVYRRIGQLAVLNYAAPKVKGEKKICKTGYSCGYSCISKSRKCRSEVGKQAATYADWLGKQAGGAIVLAKSSIQTTGSRSTEGDQSRSTQSKSQSASDSASDTKSQSKAPPSVKTATDKIDEKYAKADFGPTEIQGWLRDRLQRMITPEGLAINEISSRFAEPGTAKWNDLPSYIKRADTKEAMVEAMTRYRTEQAAEFKKQKLEITPESLGFPSQKEVDKLKARLERTKDYKKRSKINSELAELERSRERGVKAANEAKALMNKSEAQIRKDAEKEFDDQVKLSQEGADYYKKYMNEPNVNMRLTETLLKRLPQYREPEEKIARYRSEAADRERHKNIIRDYLTQKSQGDEESLKSILRLSGELTPESVRAAYRKRSMETHPDRGGSREEFEAVNKAYKQLQTQLGFSDPHEDSLFDEDLWDD